MSTGLSESAVKWRLDRLDSTGVLNLDAQLGYEHLGNGVVALLRLTVARRIGALDGVRSVETVLTPREVEHLTYEPVRRGGPAPFLSS